MASEANGLVQAALDMLILKLFTQVEQDLGEIQVRTAGDASAIAMTLYRVLADVDRRVAIVGMTTARDRVDASMAAQNMVAGVSSVFGLLALAVAAVGLSGLVAYMTTERTGKSEFGWHSGRTAGMCDAWCLVTRPGSSRLVPG